MKWLAIVMVAVATCGATAVAQQNPMQPNADAAGTVKAMRGNIIHVVNDAGDQYLIKLPDRTQYVNYNGQATIGFLKPGMIVRFSGRFDSKGNVAEPLSRLEVFTPKPPARNQPPAEEDRLGVFPEAGLGAKDLFADVDERKPTEELTGYRVAGRVTGMKNGKLYVAAGPTMMQVDVAEDAAVSISVNDWRLLQVGDRVAVSGWANPMQPSQIIAQRMEISGGQTLGLPAEKPTRPRVEGDRPKEEGGAKSEEQ